jgi:PIN domain nuclease of toxin-antitoxin system
VASVLRCLQNWPVASASVTPHADRPLKDRIQLFAPLRDWVSNALAPAGISLLPLDAETASESTLLPGEPHGDPADRFLIAAARTKGVILATRDENVLGYGGAGYVRVLAL